MVNNNGIPFEVKKPFETVYELKNETPSFEEFMKTYENDGNLNYDDLNGGDVGEVKGYGPCSSKYCTCYASSGYAPLYMKCPYCSRHDRDPELWVHASGGCGGSMYISESLYLECKRCYASGHWRTWKFGCSDHKGYEYVTSIASFQDALRMGLAMQAGSSQLQDLVARISIKLIEESRKG